MNTLQVVRKFKKVFKERIWIVESIIGTKVTSLEKVLKFISHNYSFGSLTKSTLEIDIILNVFYLDYIVHGKYFFSRIYCFFYLLCFIWLLCKNCFYTENK